MEIKNVVLASASPRRKELLLQIGIQPEIVVSHVVEQVTSSVPSEVVMDLPIYGHHRVRADNGLPGLSPGCHVGRLLGRQIHDHL